jgi:hypothetical protein
VGKLFLWVVFFVSGLLPAQDLERFIGEQCREAGVSEKLVWAILAQENPMLKFDAVHVNENGTRDLGLFQLNDRYLYSDFVPRYWKFSDTFRWDDPYHNSYVGIRHIKWLWGTCPMAVPDRSKAFTVALAYNCGLGAVALGKVPAKSVDYAVRVVKFVWGGF